MQQINDIKPIMLWSPINITTTIIFIIFIVILYFIYKKIKLGQTQRSAPTKNVGFSSSVHPDTYKKQLKELEKNIDISSQIFYKKLAEILKNILEYYWAKNISKMTFDEIKNLKLKQNLKDLIKNIYFKEYAKEINDSEEIRKELIGEIKKLIK